ncbi:MAG: hypothetical protein WBA57_09355 [Elainellaceae cyanobacterium]
MASSKSTAVKVFGILSIVFGALTLSTSPLGIVGLGSTLQQLGASGFLATWITVTTFLAPIFGIISIVLGIGLLKYAEWGRKGSIYYAIFTIAFNILSAALMGLGMSAAISANAGPEAAAVAAGIVIGAIIGGLFTMIYPVLVLIFLTRPTAKASCR